MMQKKSIWAVLFVMLMMALSVNGAVAEDDALRSGDYQYRVLEDGTAEITHYFGRDSVVHIPETLDGKTVTSIRDGAFAECSSLTSIELPDSVTSMGLNLFADCWRLKNIQVSPEQPVFAVIDGVLFNKAEKSLICYPAGKQEEAYEVPQGIQQIKSYAFYDCSALTSIKLPDSVTSIGVNLFAGCESLKNIQVSPEQPVFAVSDGVLFNKAEKSLICYPVGKQEEAYEVPQGIQQIKFGAFSCCSALTTIELPDSVTSIGESAFSDCSSLTTIELPDGVTSIGEYAFSDCSSLTSIELPDSVTSIGKSAFSDCSSLTTIELPDSVTSIGDRAFSDCSSLTTIELPDSVTSIGKSVFSDCSSLTTIELPDSVTSIGEHAFYRCRSLTSIELPDSVTSIGESAFAWCRSLTSIELPDSVTSIGDQAFWGCNNLTVTILQ